MQRYTIIIFHWRYDIMSNNQTNPAMTTNHIKNDRKSPRARWFDYNSGLYFVTVCTRNRDHFFGDVIDGKMQLNEIGRYANLQFQNVMTHYPYAEIPVWIVMPNHIHAIAAIQRRRWDGCRDVCRPYGQNNRPYVQR